MLRIAINEAHASGGNKLRAVAEALVDKALTGDVQAINSIADRLDGKVAQAIVGGDEETPAIKMVAKVINEIIHVARPAD